MSFHEVDIEKITLNPFTTFSKKWVLITAKRGNQVNTMTAAWGNLGYVWVNNTITVYVRHNRYTKEFIDAADTFSVTVFSEKYREAMAYLGRVSGKDENKIEKAELTVVYDEDTPYFEEAEQVFIAKKLYAQEFEPEKFIEKSIIDTVYQDKDFHTLYIGGIIKVLEKLAND